MADQPELVFISVTTSTTDRTDALLPGTDVHNSEFSKANAWEILDVTIEGDEGQPDVVETDVHYWTSATQTAEDYYAELHGVDASQITIKRKSRFQPDKSIRGWNVMDFTGENSTQQVEWSKLCGCDDQTCVLRCVPKTIGEQIIADLNDDVMDAQDGDN
ncbi:hypothetical protein L198_03234 [Cryptococcus wingfieldii CBS 7118]|uniref:Uncharacterized protein n=1 Tax=Cryptococcus wingfieldii CBS 7118 TaxID=1295528 RepID=A0A1E3JEY5_9TREE|nr:hypothetical protein L198_03234 [Cryptococcus wingfieldii CBS 7118]ODN99392.1 hypothetical protein L198_03234 [Cryptococcus wingfieldii CBS 7118]